MPDFDSQAWLSDRTGLAVLAVVAVALAALIALPYLQYILLGAVLAYILMPAQRRLQRVIGSLVTALILVAVAILAILLPTMYVLAIALRQALDVITAVEEGTLAIGDVEQYLETSGVTVDLADLYTTYEESIESALQGLATTGLDFATGLPSILIGLTVTVFVLFALLHEGDRLVAWTQTVVPADDDVLAELIAELDQLMWASVVGNVAVAAIQAVLLGIGLALLGVPAVVFLTVATFVLSLLPLVGAFGVWIPVSLYLLALGDITTAAILVVYGSLVSASDTYLRPALIGKTGAFNSAIIVVGIFGGIVVFGGVGLFVGPVVLGGAKVTLDLFARERSTTDEEPPAEMPADTDEDAAVETDPETGIRSDREESAVEEAADDREPTADEQEPTADDRSAESDADQSTESPPDRPAESDAHPDS